MSVISGIVGAVLGAKSADKAQQTNAQNVQKTNNVNLALSMMNRGADVKFDAAGNPYLPTDTNPQSVLPYYMGKTEENAGKTASGVSDAIQSLYGSPGLTLDQYQRILNSYGPQFDQTNKTAADIASGAMGGQMVAEGQPVWDQRLQGATAKKNAALESLRDTLNSIDAMQARRGFAGDSLGSNLTKFGARRTIATGAADDLNQAMLQNALEKQSLQQKGRDLQVNNLNLPTTMSNAALARTGAAATQLSTNVNTAMQPLNFFKIGGSPAQYSQLPTVQPVSALAGVASGVGGFNASLANGLAKQQVAKNVDQSYLGAAPAASFGTSADAGTGALGGGGGAGTGQSLADIAGEVS